MTLQRDAFIKVIYEAARNDNDIVFLSADFGAEALDAFREELPDQFMHCGISEAHMIDMATGLALAGKKVYTYCMGPFVLRAYEQIKQMALMRLPVTIIGGGVGLGYADSGPTHYVTEDIACMRALNGIEILTASDNHLACSFANISLQNPALRYIRLDRSFLPSVRKEISPVLDKGFRELEKGQNICILSSGYMLHKALEARDKLVEHGIYVGVVDLFRIKPIDVASLRETLSRYMVLITVEEQGLSGGFGSAVLEVVDPYMRQVVSQMGLPDRYVFENGGRDLLLDSFGLSPDGICAVADEMHRQWVGAC